MTSARAWKPANVPVPRRTSRRPCRTRYPTRHVRPRCCRSPHPGSRRCRARLHQRARRRRPLLRRRSSSRFEGNDSCNSPARPAYSEHSLITWSSPLRGMAPLLPGSRASGAPEVSKATPDRLETSALSWTVQRYPAIASAFRTFQTSALGHRRAHSPMRAPARCSTHWSLRASGSHMGLAQPPSEGR